MGTDSTQDNRKVTCVLDTSFLIDLAINVRWTLEALKLIRNTDSKIVVPYGVEWEFKNLLSHGKTDNFQIPILEEGIEDLLETRRYSTYRKRLDVGLSQRLDDEVDKPSYKKPKELSRVDKTIVQAVLDY